MEFHKEFDAHEQFETVKEERSAYMKYYLERNYIMLAGKKNFMGADVGSETKEVYNRSFVLFEYENETVAYDFIKKDPFYLNGWVDNWNIEEVEIFSRGMTTQLSQVYTYLAR